MTHETTKMGVLDHEHRTTAVKFTENQIENARLTMEKDWAFST